MLTDNPYVLVHNLGLLQREAGVDPEVAELVCAFARLKADSRQPVKFYRESVDPQQLAGQYMHQWVMKKNPEADPRILDFLIAYAQVLSGKGLPVVYNTAHLAAKRRMTARKLQWMARHQPHFYKEFNIPKKNGTARRIAAPQDELLSWQRWILQRILRRGKPHKYASAFIKGRSILYNVRPHLRRKVVVRIDLQDFFPSITHRRVRKVFESFGYPYRVAVLLANLCTLKGRLPQGAPTSPALSNLVCRKMDERFAKLAGKMKFRYSRYADDLIFSSNNARMTGLVPFFKEIIREEGFRVNEDKLRIMRAGQRQKVTGIVVNEKPNLPRTHVRTLRAVAHRMQQQGPEAVTLSSRRNGIHDPLYVFNGHAGYLQMINPPRARQLKQSVG
jgi:retron-type reverse transcriptase